MHLLISFGSQGILGASEYSAQLGANFSQILTDKY
jgi:hypothetical protein